MTSELAQHTGLSADRLSFILQHLISKDANVLVKYLPEYQELVHISVHKCIPTYSIKAGS